MKKIIKFTTALLSVFAFLIFGFISYYNNILPNNIMIYDNESVHFNTKIKMTSENEDEINSVSNIRKNSTQSYTTNLKLMGVVPVKSINIKVVKQKYVSLGGNSFGIKIFTKGIMVVGMSDVKSVSSSINPAKQAGLKIGDIILKVDGESVNSNDELSKLINKSNGKTMDFLIKRENDTFSVKFSPVMSSETGDYKAGLWVRDSTAGLGTMTFYSPVDGTFAGLGHGIVDVDTGILLPVNSGEIVKTDILSVTKSKEGTAGELCGAFTGEKLGTLIKNTQNGVYGVLDECDENNNLILIANKQDVKTGNAKIYTCIDNSPPKYYDCVIERVDYNDDEQKNLLVRITDKELISKTGGIVQGMSGSPIVQNGQLVGALTNVFVNHPEKGYAVFAENMLETAQSITK